MNLQKYNETSEKHENDNQVNQLSGKLKVIYLPVNIPYNFALNLWIKWEGRIAAKTMSANSNIGMLFYEVDIWLRSKTLFQIYSRELSGSQNSDV